MSRVIIDKNKYLYIDGYKAISHYDTEALKIVLEDNTLSITGKGLVLEGFSSHEIYISGKIASVEWENRGSSI